MPGGKGNIRPEDANGFDKNPQNINLKGRPKKIYTILKETGYSATDIKAAFGELAFYTVKDLDIILNDESKPVITRIVANQFKEALGKSDYYKIKEILEHSIGKPTQSIDLESTIKKEVKGYRLPDGTIITFDE